MSMFPFMILIASFKFPSLRKGIKMRANKIICFAIGAMLAATAAAADETLIVSNVLGPEGPLIVDGNLYYVGWVSHTLSKWDGKTSTVLNHTPGCGHNGLALTKQKTFLLACTEEHGAIMKLDLTGKQLRGWDADKNGQPFDGGINATIYGAEWCGGKSLKLSSDGKLLHVFEIAAGDGTTNVAFSDGEKELYVTVVKDPKDPQAKGSIVKIANVK